MSPLPPPLHINDQSVETYARPLDGEQCSAVNHDVFAPFTASKN